MLENAIQDFARRMNMPSFALNHNGLASLLVGENMSFNLEKTDEELILYLTVPALSYDNAAAARCLELCHYKYNYPYTLFSGFFRDTHVLLLRFKHNEVTAAVLENAFHFLMDMPAKLEA